jgi:hypothetical protein
MSDVRDVVSRETEYRRRFGHAARIPPQDALRQPSCVNCATSGGTACRLSALLLQTVAAPVWLVRLGLARGGGKECLRSWRASRTMLPQVDKIKFKIRGGSRSKWDALGSQGFCAWRLNLSTGKAGGEQWDLGTYHRGRWLIWASCSSGFVIGSRHGKDNLVPPAQDCWLSNCWRGISVSRTSPDSRVQSAKNSWRPTMSVYVPGYCGPWHR